MFKLHPYKCTVTNSGSPRLSGGKGTPIENLIEFAGRVCYQSTDSMGHSPTFIKARIAENHMDIIEHGYFVASATQTSEGLLQNVLLRNRYLSGRLIHKLENRENWIIGGNIRAWLSAFSSGDFMGMIPYVLEIFPSAQSMFPSFKPNTANDTRWGGNLGLIDSQTHDMPLLGDVNFAQQKVTTKLGAGIELLGYCPIIYDELASATLHFTGVSRSLTHQLVRHRLASFSQVSQRYVDLSKGEWQAIIPPAISGNSAAKEIMTTLWDSIEVAYSELRNLGIRKEDARYLLLNSCETEIVVSMPFSAWRHFFLLRALDKAAQWEIRDLAINALKVLHRLSPIHWDDITEELKSMGAY